MIYYSKEYCMFCSAVNGVSLGELKDFTVDNIWGYKCWNCQKLVKMGEYDGSHVQDGCKILEI